MLAQRERKRFKWTTKKTLFLVFGLAVAVSSYGAYIFFFQNNFSSEDILVKVSAPKGAKNGKEITWLVTVKNNSEIGIENLKLTFTYPKGVFDKKDKIIQRKQKLIDSLAAGETTSESFSGIIFGTEGEVKKAIAFLTYSPDGYSGKFEDGGSCSTVIDESLTVFEMKIPRKANPGEEFVISLSYQSGFSFPLEDVQVKILVPEGFEVLSKLSENSGRLEKNKIIFDIGSLNEQEGGKREIRGKLNGQVKDKKLFSAEFGRFDQGLYQFVPLDSTSKKIEILSTTLDFFRKVNGQYNYVAKPGEKLRHIIEFSNNGDNIYRDLELIVELKSSVLDFSTLKASGGVIEGNKIKFSSDDFPDLLYLEPYGKAKVGFTVDVKDFDASACDKASLIDEKITLGTIQKSFQTPVASNTIFDQEIFYAIENSSTEIQNSFKKVSNKKPIIVWEIMNFGNEIKDSKITATIPEGIEYLKEVYPQDAKFKYNKKKRELTLNMESISQCVSSQKFAFQIEIGSGDPPGELVEDVIFTGSDKQTGEVVIINK